MAMEVVAEEEEEEGAASNSLPIKLGGGGCAQPTAFPYLPDLPVPF